MKSDAESTDSESDNDQNEMIRCSVVEVKDLLSPVTSEQYVDRAVQEHKQSLRTKETFDCGNVALDTTAEFRDFLAKKLVDNLYSKLKFKKFKEESEVESSCSKVKSSVNAGTAEVWGFRLFSTSDPSTPFLEHQPVVQRRRKRRKSSSSEEDEQKFSSVAVTADMIRAEQNDPYHRTPGGCDVMTSAVLRDVTASSCSTAVSTVSSGSSADAVTQRSVDASDDKLTWSSDSRASLCGRRKAKLKERTTAIKTK